MPGILYVVATPIGNLEDVTLRALRILREVSLIAAEDTRRTARLLQHYSISTRTTSLHEHNERAKTPALIDRLQAGRIDCARVGRRHAGDLGSRRAPGRRGACRGHPGRTHSWGRVRSWPPSLRPGYWSGSSSSLAFPQIGQMTERHGWQGWPTRHDVLVLFEAPHRIRETLEDIAGHSRRPGHRCWAVS